MEKTSWIVQHAGICLGAGSQRDSLVDQFKVWRQNTRTGVELTEIDYTALSFAVPQKVVFRYMLEGHDVGW